jgi:hypothetical protein
MMVWLELQSVSFDFVWNDTLNLKSLCPMAYQFMKLYFHLLHCASVKQGISH